MPDELVISSSTDAADIVQAVANNDEAGARTAETAFQSEELDGVSRESNSGAPPRPVRSLSYESPQNSRVRLLQALAEAENEFEELSTEQVTTNEPSGAEAAAEQEPGDIDIAAVRAAATQDAIEPARRLQQDAYYAQQQNQHLAPAQTEINALRAELLPPFQEKVKALLAGADVTQFQEASRVQLSEQVLDSLLTLPGGAESTAFLMRNPAEVRKLSALPAHMAIAHIAQLANRMNPAAQRDRSAAPAPIRPVGGSSTKSSVPPDELPYQEFKKQREREIKARYRR